MLCSRCGSPIYGDQEYCSKCGTKIEMKAPTSFKKRLLFFFAAIFVFLMLVLRFSSSHEESLIEAVEGQLKALRNNKVTEAYYVYTSKDFQSNVPLKTFKELISTYTALSQNQSFSMNENMFLDNLAILKGTLKSANNEHTPVEYELIQEDNKWKILSILLAVPQPKDGQTQPAIDWLMPIDTQLRLLREKKIKEAYEQAHSAQFRKATSLEDFEKFIEKNPVFVKHTNIIVKTQSLQKDEAQVTIILDPEKEPVPITYLLVKEDGAWKIWNMNLAASQSPKVANLLKDTDSIKKTVKDQLETIKKDEIIKAYSSEFMSKAFKQATSLEDFRKFVGKYPILTQFDQVELTEPVIENGTAKLEVTLRKDTFSHITLEYTLGIENEAWKVWGLQALEGKKSNSAQMSS